MQWQEHGHEFPNHQLFTSISVRCSCLPTCHPGRLIMPFQLAIAYSQLLTDGMLTVYSLITCPLHSHSHSHSSPHRPGRRFMLLTPHRTFNDQNQHSSSAAAAAARRFSPLTRAVGHCTRQCGPRHVQRHCAFDPRLHDQRSEHRD